MADPPQPSAERAKDVAAIAGPPPAPGRSAPPPAAPTIVERLRAAPITFAILAINLGWFLWAEKHGSTETTDILLRFGAVEPIHVWSGEHWRVASYMFLHIGWIHLLWNSYAGFGICADVERALGRWRFLVAYLVSGVAGGCATVITTYEGTSAGASGAMFGMIGALLALKHRQLGSFRAFLADRGTRATLVNAGIWLVIGTYVNFNNRAHFGGLVAGAAITWAMASGARRLLVPAFAVAFGALVIGSLKPWWRPRGEELEKLNGLAASYLTGKGLTKNEARGLRFAKKACEAGSQAACEALERDAQP